MGKIPITERVTGHTELIGLIAYPIRHSMSPTMHNKALKKEIDMMLYQGAAAFKLWTGKDMPIDYIRDILFE